MRREWIDVLASPLSGQPLALESARIVEGDEVTEGVLRGPAPGEIYRIRNGIPRFIEGQNYADSFGDQWNRHRRVQLDKFNGTDISATRLFEGTQWNREGLRDQLILDVGCGAGRFTQILLDAGARVCALDISEAVEACWANNGSTSRLSVVQADVYALPLRRGAFDRVLCYGMLQHTPDVKRAFLSLLPAVRHGGWIAIDVYKRQRWVGRFNSKYWYRPITKRLPRPWIWRTLEWYIPRWLPIDSRLKDVRVLRTVVPTIVPCWNYSGELPLNPSQLADWAILDTFDALTPKYDQPQRMQDVAGWFEEAGLTEIEVREGGNGIVACGRKAR